MRGFELSRAIPVALVGQLLSACAFLTPLPQSSTLADRLAALPIEGTPVEHDVVIHWNEHQIPFIEARTDTDLAFALGLIHAHLRLGQMEILRRISQGRLAEMAGPYAVDVDHSLRTLNFARPAAAIEAAMPAETRRWLEAFVSGINHYLARTEALPHEFTVLGLGREPWRVADLLTIGRLASTDVNWLVWFELLRLRDRPDWPQLWAGLVTSGRTSLPSFGEASDLAAFTELLGGVSRSGSNSFAVSQTRSGTGGALIANDPHLGIYLPNLWLIVGFKSPSYHAVGLMLPGLPFLALGRNPHIAWGGTNMRAASSDLYDIGDVPADQLSQRRETIGVRW